jgi:hypothetical protein
MKFGETSETMEGSCFVTIIIGLNRSTIGNDDYDDKGIKTEILENFVY